MVSQQTGKFASVVPAHFQLPFSITRIISAAEMACVKGEKKQFFWGRTFSCFEHFDPQTKPTQKTPFNTTFEKR